MRISSAEGLVLGARLEHNHQWRDLIHAADGVRLSRRTAFWAILACIWRYTLFVGASATVIRAAVMGTIVVGGFRVLPWAPLLRDLVRQRWLETTLTSPGAAAPNAHTLLFDSLAPEGLVDRPVRERDDKQVTVRLLPAARRSRDSGATHAAGGAASLRAKDAARAVDAPAPSSSIGSVRGSQTDRAFHRRGRP